MLYKLFKTSLGCITVVIEIVIFFFVATNISGVINNWLKPYVSRQTFNWLSDVVFIVVGIFLVWIIDFIIRPFFKKYIRYW